MQYTKELLSLMISQKVLWGLIVAILFIIPERVEGQDIDYSKGSVYKVNKTIEIPLTLALFASNYGGFKFLDRKQGLAQDEIMGLDPSDIWWFDRIATQQDADERFRNADISDYIMNATLVIPCFLAFDKKIRKDWLDLLVLYGETHALNSSLYITSATFIDRTRPFLYNPDVPYGYKDETGTTVSFFSGHTATTAAASFFMAKVYSDYHPELEIKKYWLYAAAIIPPALVGFYRYKAMKHFPTDVYTGLVVGSLSGILIPHFHKRKNKMKGFSIMASSGEVTGCKIGYRF